MNMETIHSGFVYCIGEKPGGYVKVGYSTNPLLRLNKIRADNAAPVVLLGVLPGNVALEAALHSKFAGRHIRGEWFDDTDLAVSGHFEPMPAKADAREICSLRDWLIVRGVTQAQLCAHLGIMQGQLSKILSGQQAASLEFAFAVECATGGEVPIAFWLKDSPRVTPIFNSPT